MKSLLYTVVDTVAELTIGPVLKLPNDAAARRVFQDAVMGEGSQLGAHPSDYVLVCVGSMDDDGTVVGLKEPVHVISGDLIVELSRKPSDELNPGFGVVGAPT